MVRSSGILAALRLSLLLAAAGASWAPLPLSHFSAGVGAKSGTQRFRHEEHNVLQDGSSVHLRWEVDAEPESLLALDWEHRNGIALVSCERGRLVLRVPRAHAARAARWRHVTASGQLHGCGHLAGRDLYHRVLHVAARGPAGEAEAVTLATEELSSPSQLFPHCSFAVALRPPAKIASGPASHDVRRLRSSGRRLEDANVMERPHEEGGEKPLATLEKAAEGLMPKTDYNWTWNFSFAPTMPLNTHVDLQFPSGISGFLKSDTSTLDVNLSLALNYTSQKVDEGAAPKAHFVGQLDLDLNLDTELSAALDFKDAGESVETPPMKLDNLLPLPMKLGSMRFFLGSVPVTLEPSFDGMALQVRHSGVFDGSFEASVKTSLSMSVLAEFDTLTGLNTQISSIAKDSNVVPPTILISAQDFELNLALVANASIQPFFNASLRPEIKMSVSPMEKPTSFPTLPPMPTLPPSALPTLPPPSMPTLPMVAGMLMPNEKCEPRDLIVKVNATVEATTSVVPLLHLFSESDTGKLGDLLPSMVCAAGACKGTPPGCKSPSMGGISIHQLAIKINRTISVKELGPGLTDQLAFGLALFPDAVEVLTSLLQNSTDTKLVREDVEDLMKASAGHLVKDLEKGIEAAEHKGLHEADAGLATGAEGAEDFFDADGRRLAAAGGPKEYNTFLVQVKDSPHYEITDELLQSLAREGAFRVRDGRERALGHIRVSGIRLLKPAAAPKQMLWDQAGVPVARAASDGMSSRLGQATLLAAVALIGLGAVPKLWRRCARAAAPPAQPME